LAAATVGKSPSPRVRKRFEVDPAEQQPERRHDHVLHQRIDDLAERRADDDPYREIEGTALDGKLPELRKQTHADSPFMRQTYPRFTFTMHSKVAERNA
jgi:hypothetical protein